MMDNIAALYRYISANYESDLSIDDNNTIPTASLLVLLAKLDIKSASIQEKRMSYVDYMYYANWAQRNKVK